MLWRTSSAPGTDASGAMSQHPSRTQSSLLFLNRNLPVSLGYSGGFHHVAECRAGGISPGRRIFATILAISGCAEEGSDRRAAGGSQAGSSARAGRRRRARTTRRGERRSRRTGRRRPRPPPPVPRTSGARARPEAGPCRPRGVGVAPAPPGSAVLACVSVTASKRKPIHEMSQGYPEIIQQAVRQQRLTPVIPEGKLMLSTQEPSAR